VFHPAEGAGSVASSMEQMNSSIPSVAVGEKDNATIKGVAEGMPVA